MTTTPARPGEPTDVAALTAALRERGADTYGLPGMYTVIMDAAPGDVTVRIEASGCQTSIGIGATQDAAILAAWRGI